MEHAPRPQEPLAPGEAPSDNPLAANPELAGRQTESAAEVQAQHSERLDPQQWQHDRLMVTGPALIAAVLDRDRDKVEAVDLSLTARDRQEELRSRVDSLADLAGILDPSEYSRLEQWLQSQGYSERPLNLVKVDELVHENVEVAKYQPLLMLWGDSEVDYKRPAPYSHATNYSRGLWHAFETGPVLPERLEPNGTLARAMTVLEWGERFGLEYDASAPREAERAARSGRLIVSAEVAQDEWFTPEQTSYTVIDPAFMEAFADPELKRHLQLNYPRLSQVADEAATAGGVQEYIRREYGQAYLGEAGLAPNYARLYDVKLGRSPAPLEQQQEFLRFWRSQPEGLRGSLGEKTADNPELPQPEGLRELIDGDQLAEAIQQRQQAPQHLERATGNYKVVVDSNEPAARAKLEAYASIMGLDLTQLGSDARKITRSLIRLGVDPRNPVLGQLGVTQPHEVELAISTNPEDILQASYKKSWDSCVDLEEGGEAGSLYEDIANGAAVAYLVKDGSFVARRLIRAGETIDAQEPAAAIENAYGDERYFELMRQAVKQALEAAGIKTEQAMITPAYSEDAVFDSATGQTEDGRRYYYTEAQH